MKRRFGKAIAAVLGLALLAGFWWTRKPHAPEVSAAEAGAPTRVTVTRVKGERIPIFIDAVGTLRSENQTMIAARVLAQVERVTCRAGDRVAADDLLVELDARDPEARVAQARAALAAEEEVLADALTEHGRTRRLLEREASTRQAMDRASARLETATARRDAAREALSQARVALAFTRVKAPFAGVVFERHVEAGDLARPGQPLIGLFDPRELQLEAVVEEGLLPRLSGGQGLSVSVGALGEEAARVQGTVREIDPAVDPTTRTGTVKIDLPELDGAGPGMFGRVRIPAGERDAVLVPTRALVVRGQLEMVFVVGEDGRARMHLVRAGRPVPAPDGDDPDARKGRVEILSGLEPGVEIVVTGAGELFDGAPLEVTGEWRQGAEGEGR